MSDYCAEYVRYLGIAKTERRSYAESVRLLEKRGFKDISKFKALKPGDKVYRGYEGRTVMAAVIGRKNISEAGAILSMVFDCASCRLKRISSSPGESTVGA